MHGLYPCVAGACILLPILLCAVLLHHEYWEQQGHWRERLSRTADLNQQLIHNWLQERSGDARLLASLVATSSVAPIESDNQNPRLAVPGRRLLKTTLTSVASSYDYAGAYVLDYAGKVQATSEGAFILPAAAAAACRESSGQNFLTLPSPAGRAEYPQLAIITPVHFARASRGSSGGVTHACVVLLLRSAAFHQLRLAGREASSTGETLLVILQQNQPLFISPLRNWASVTAPAVGAPGRFAVLQQREGLGEYRDYRGTPVLAATRFIPGVAWGLLTKVDRSEVFSGFHHVLVLGVSLTLLTVGLLMSLANSLWSRWRRQRYREALLNASIGLALISPKGRLLNVNRCFCKITGYREQELRGRDSLSLIHPDDRERDLAMSRRMAAGEASSSSLEERYRCKDGSTVWVKRTVSPVRNRRGRITSTILLLEDITERRLAEITRQESEQRFRQLSEAAFEAIAIHDHGVLLSANDQYFRMLGYRPEELLGKQAIPLTIAAEARPVLEAQVSTGGEGPYEATALRKNGTTLPVEVRVRTMTYGGRQARVAAIADITERRQAEAKLRSYERVVEGVEEMIAVVDRDYRYLLANRAFLKYRGLERDQILGRPVREFADKIAFDNIIKSKLDECFVGNVVKYELRYNFPGLGEKDVFLSYFPIWGAAGVEFAACIVQDITEQKRAQEALCRSEARYRSLFERNPAGIVRSASGLLSDCNPAFARLLGYNSPEDIRGLPLTQFYLHPEDRRIMLDRLREQGCLRDYEVCARHKSGATLWLACNFVRVPAENDEPDMVEGIVLDLSGRKKAEEDLRQAQKLEAVGQLVGGVAHDFRNLLTGITLCAQMLQSELAGSPCQEEVEQILHAAERASELVNHLLAFSRKQPRVLEILDLNGIVERTARLLRRTLGERINLVLQCSPELWPVKADDGQMVQVLMNLGLNARDAMPLGGTLTIRTRNLSQDRDPLPCLLAQQNCVCLEVEDEGSGISPEVKERIFEPFFTTKGPGRGTGLGLSTVYGIVKQGGGDIQVESEPGSGARFSIFLPRAEKLPAPIPSLQPSSSLAPTGGVILLVEDEQVVRESLARVLTSSGYSVLKASNGVEAEALAARVPRIDFLLTDLVMPRMGGTVLARLMSKRHPELRVLFMSGYPDEELDTEEAGRRQTAFIQKPFTTSSLVDKLLDLKAS